MTAERTWEVVLPFGVADGRGRRAREATLVPITGRGELDGAEDGNPFAAALRLLAASLRRLGPFRVAGPGVLGQLLPVDRDWLLVQLNRLAFGDVRYETVICPQEACGKRVEIRFDLSTVTAPDVPADATGRLALPDGRELVYRLPCASDQVALHGVPAEALEAAFLARCVLPAGAARSAEQVAALPAGAARSAEHVAALPAGAALSAEQVAALPPGAARSAEQAAALPPGAALSSEQVAALPPELRRALVREILAASPALDLTLDLACVECGQPFRFVHDPVRSLLAELRASRLGLLQEVHYLARHYHWSQAEILGLPRDLRREYLGLIAAELEQRQRGIG